MAKQSFSVGQVLTAAQMLSLQQTAMGGGSATAKTASYTLVADDAGTVVSVNSTSATTITVNTGLFAAGDSVTIQNLNTGVVTITAGTATVNSSSSLALAQYEGGQLYFVSASAAIFFKSDGAASGGITLLSTTALTGAITTISAINGTYKNLVAVIYQVTNATADGAFRCAPNGSTNITTFTGTRLDMNQSNDGYLFITGPAASTIDRTQNTNAFFIEIFDYANTTYFKPVKFGGNFHLSGHGGAAVNYAGSIKTTSAITSLAFSNSGGNLSTGTVLLYGVK